MSTKIIYTQTDEAPALATYSLLPIVRAFTKAAGLAVETRDISLAGRILAAFPDNLKPAQRQSDDLAELGELAKTPEANIIKLPNISASVPQLQATIAELLQQGYSGPAYPEEPKNAAGKKTVLKDSVAVDDAELISSTAMRKRQLREFYKSAIADAKKNGVLLSLHLKATMMKVSDPIMFGHAVTEYYADVFAKHAATFAKLGVEPNNGIGDVYTKIASLPADQQAAIKADLDAVYKTRPSLAMVDSSKGITNLHVPSDVIVDASMPAAIRSSGDMWGPDGKLHDTTAMIPDRCYSGIYQEVIEDCKKNGAFDVPTMGNVANVGLMAQKAEEYGSHDKTFEIAAKGRVRVVDPSGQVLAEHAVEAGDIWRMCQTKDLPIRDWVKLAVER